MRFQKILILVSLVVAALSVLYAWIFCSGVFAQITLKSVTEGAPEITELSDAAQNFTDLFQILGIVMVLCVVLLYITACNSRRKYYITNYIAIGIVVAYMLVYAVLLIVNLTGVSSLLASTDLTNAKAAYDAAHYNDTLFGAFQTYSWTIPVGYAYFAIVIVDALLICFNLVWKILLMKGEKKLLENSIVEVA